MSRSATPATQSAAATTAPTGAQARHQNQPNAISATPATQNDGRCREAPRLPHKTKVDVAKCHACNAKCRGDQNQPNAISATPATQNDGRCRQVPRLPRKTKVHVAKPHACHAKCRGDHGAHRDPNASPEPAQCHKCHACHAKRRSMSRSSTPATQNEGRCRQVPSLPRKCVSKLCVGKLCVCVCKLCV